MSRSPLRLNPDSLRDFAKRPEVRAASYPLGGRDIRGRIVRGGLEIVPDSVFYGRTRSLVGVLIVVVVPSACILLFGDATRAWAAILGAIAVGLGLMLSDKPPFFTHARTLASVRSGILRYMGLEWRTEIIGGLVVLESFEHPGFHCITHLVVDTAGQPLFCLAQRRRECGKTNLTECHLRLLDRALGSGVWHIRPGIEGDEILFRDDLYHPRSRSGVASTEPSGDTPSVAAMQWPAA